MRSPDARRVGINSDRIVLVVEPEGSPSGFHEEHIAYVAALAVVSGVGSHRCHGTRVVPTADRLGVAWSVASWCSWLLRRGLPALGRSRVRPACLRRLGRLVWRHSVRIRQLCLSGRSVRRPLFRCGLELCDRSSLVWPRILRRLAWLWVGWRLWLEWLLPLWLWLLGISADRRVTLSRFVWSRLWTGWCAAIHGTVVECARQRACIWACIWACPAAGSPTGAGKSGTSRSRGGHCRTRKQRRCPTACCQARGRRRPTPADGPPRFCQARIGARCLPAGCHHRA